MQKQTYSLVLRQEREADQVKKQCKMCGKVTIFTDTTIKRHNANGKSIYQFAIYKCPKNHTWNKKLDTYKSFSEHVDPETLIPTEFDSIKENEKIIFVELVDLDVIECKVMVVEGSFRLDQALASQIEGLSRNEIVQKIKKGSILLNNGLVKPSQKISLHDTILIHLK
ncbi:cytoplasmic protein [Neobacillus sp. WH10]|uniref:S4 domain-containing protein n=1 Tax=Neobacillus sp. WH10 TaxID=3047873 RepID=UPI0024C11642|nr:S4 domain-containing protein [Neobacillus sp. WH10]WHY78422.1 cytoplasmic protein [Neobacillus sp. WH10]